MHHALTIHISVHLRISHSSFVCLLCVRACVCMMRARAPLSLVRQLSLIAFHVLFSLLTAKVTPAPKRLVVESYSLFTHFVIPNSTYIQEIP